MLLLLYSYTRDIPASTGYISGCSSRNGLSNHVRPRTSCFISLVSPFSMERQYPEGNHQRCDRSPNKNTLKSSGSLRFSHLHEIETQPRPCTPSINHDSPRHVLE